MNYLRRLLQRWVDKKAEELNQLADELELLLRLCGASRNERRGDDE